MEFDWLPLVSCFSRVWRKASEKILWEFRNSLLIELSLIELSELFSRKLLPRLVSADKKV